MSADLPLPLSDQVEAWQPKLPFSTYRNKYGEQQVVFPYDEGSMLCPIASDGIDGPPEEYREPLARFIVRACNSHYELLEALQEAHRALMHYEWYANPASGWAAPDKKFVRHMTDAAIAKATGAA